uniref:Odorant-binding protein 32 n=1 Tax=Pyrrhalta maculicollis TaxID=226885 RepID=A0A1J0KKB6_9CUCU|nr:odorant-binding protein 32 [Pyrrhalta maculicollis]
MKFFILFAVCVAAVNCIDDSEFSEKSRNFMKYLHDTCYAQTNVKDEYIEAHKKGNFYVNDISLKKYISCLWTTSKALNANFDLDASLLYGVLPPRVAYYLVPIYMDCAKQVKFTVPFDTPIEEKTFLVNICVYYRNPYEFVFF